MSRLRDERDDEFTDISEEPDREWLLNSTVEITNGCAKLLNLDAFVSREEVTLTREYVGKGYMECFPRTVGLCVYRQSHGRIN